MSKQLIEGLNPEQSEAITYEGGPLLILAGAGSGKTRVITHRFANLSKKHSPKSLLTVTFTNKAANEMKERISHLTRKGLSGAWIGTFHSQCSRILRKEIKALGFSSNFSIYDETDQANLIRHILKEFKIYEALYKGILNRISNLKAACVSPEEFLSNGGGFGFEDRLARVYVRYQDELRRCNALDFDDLIMHTVSLFKNDPALLEKYQQRFSHVLVDEFQDTNVAQYMLVKQLCSAHNNICVVGDDDQSIYAFRGANIRNILSFEKDYPKARTIRLEQNYRSTQKILDVSGCVINDITHRRPKTLWSDRKDGEKVTRCRFNTEFDEARYIAKLIREFYLKGIYEFKDFAILFRTNIQSKPLEDALRREDISYRVLGGISFYQRKEIKDMTAYMRLALNRDDNVCLRRVINCPPRGIGASTLKKIEQEAKKKSLSLYASMKNIVKSGGLTAATRDKLEGFMNLIEEISSAGYSDAADMLKNIYIKTGYSEYVADERAENVVELISAAEGQGIDEFTDSILLASSSEDPADDSAVSLLTLHNAKGLEFPVVFITGLDEGVLPYFKAETPAEVDEERRLLYVGMTRAKNVLFLTSAKRRKLYSKVQELEPSRFLKSVPEGLCLRVEKVAESLSQQSSKGDKIKTFRPALAYSIGTRVKHPKWGVGVVRDCYGEKDDQKITVNFPDFGIKRLALKFANIERIR